VTDLALGKRPRRTRLLGAVTGAGLVLAGVAGYMLVTHLTGEGSATRPQTLSEQAPLVSASGLAQKDGVRISQLAVTGAGGLIDLRYQVLDADKAAIVHGGTPVMVDEGTGVVVNQLLMGHKHKGALHAGQTYYLVFLNPGNLVRHGARMTVQLGDARVAHVPVQ
jgi:hypothetical protein